MTTASVLVTVSTAWSASSEKVEAEGKLCRTTRSLTAIAARELRETPATKEQALSIMRNWILKNQDIRNVRQDDNFLLRFLRHKKYSIPMAQQTLLKYLSLRKYYPQCFSNLDCEDQKMQDILKNGYISVSPVRDREGRRVIIYNLGNFNATKYTCWDMSRFHAIVYESLLEDPVDQVCGFTHIGDGGGISGAHVTTWNPADFARLMKWGEQSLPIRHKAFHLINMPSAIKYIIDFAVSKVTPKMGERLHIHSNLKQLHKNTDIKCLPTMYGGQLPFEEMIEFTRQLLSEQRKKLLGLDDMEILSTRGIISSRDKGNSFKSDIGSVEGSFRKLDID